MGYRIQRVEEEIKQKLYSAMQKDLMELNLGIVTVSKVRLTPDMRIARVYVTFLDNKESPEKCVERLNFRKKHIRFILGKSLHIRHIPELEFFYDDTLDYSERINKILNDLKAGGHSER
ncbi:MAG: 30S ribosome-binding factor RbfA [Ignavibacteria bacterium]